MQILKRIFDKKGSPVLMAVFVVLLVMEGRKALRRRTQPSVKRAVTNVTVALPAFALMRLLLLPAMVQLAHRNQQWRLGLNHRYTAPSFVQWAVSFLLLDYSNYGWHVLNHKLPILWRFHLVHHSDPDLDVTTAVRFHFGEMVGSLLYRGACVVLTGATALQVLLYEILFEGATQFHHSNWRLPLRVEEGLNTLFVTPRMHGIHHSVVEDETNSNYSVVFSFWDRLHRTFRMDVPQDTITIGVAGYQDAAQLTPRYLWKLPFIKIRH